MKNIKAVVFDFNGVFVNPAEQRIIGSVCEKTKFGAWIAHSNFLVKIFDFERGLLSPRVFWQKVFPFMNDAQYHELIEAEYEKPFERSEKLYALAEKLSKKFGVYCISNSNFLQGKACRKQGLYSPFKEVFLSHEMGEAKPFPGIYRKFLGLTGLMPDECVFIDDSLRNIIVPALLGFRVIYFKGPGHLEDELGLMGLI